MHHLITWLGLQGATSSLSTSHPLWILGHEYSTLGKSSSGGVEPELDEEVNMMQPVFLRMWLDSFA